MPLDAIAMTDAWPLLDNFDDHHASSPIPLLNGLPSAARVSSSGIPTLD